MLFAETDVQWYAVLVPLCVGIGVLLTKVADVLRGRRKDALGEWGSIAERQQTQLDRQASQIATQQQKIEQLVTLHADCRAETQEIYGFLAMLYGMVKDKVPGLPEMPPRPSRQRDAVVEYIQRSTQHSTDITRKTKRPSDEVPGTRG